MKRKLLAFGMGALLTMVITGCARKPSDPAVDPYENFNRAVFAFNQDVDHLVYRPVAKVYDKALPNPVKRGVRNVFDNVDELNTMCNDFLQGKMRYVFLDFWRFTINSTIGIAGLFDVASHLNMPKHYNDFGMTLADWSNNNNSPYLQIPLLGPSTFRDGLGLIFDYPMSPYPYLRPTGWNYYSQAVYFIDLRAQLLPTDTLIDEAFDPYIFVRDAYLQHRNASLEANEKNEMGQAEKPGLYRTTTPVAPLLESN